MTLSSDKVTALKAAITFLLVGVLLCGVYATLTKKHKTVAIANIDFGRPEPQTYYAPQEESKSTQTITMTQRVTGDVDKSTEVVTSSITTEQYKEKVQMTHITSPNVKLYQIADQYFQVYYKGHRVSPLFPLALANVETPGRADNSLTWSALFPSKYVDLSLVDTFDVTYVAQDPVTYNALMHEWSTRDRGALQMSPTYGTNIPEVNALMGVSEKEKLAVTQVVPAAQSWANGASTEPGDRFNTHDVCLRLMASAKTAITQIESKNITIHNDAELIVMLAMYHHRSGVWQVSGAGGWLSTQSCLDYVHEICSQESITNLREYYLAHPDALTLDAKTALAYVGSYGKYTTSSLEASYPVKVLYSYIVMMNKY